MRNPNFNDRRWFIIFIAKAEIIYILERLKCLITLLIPDIQNINFKYRHPQFLEALECTHIF